MKKAGILTGAVLLGLCVNAHPQTLSLALSGGIFFPAERTYWDIYGLSLPLDVEVRLGVFRHLGLAAGLSYIRDGGQATNIDQGQDSYRLRYRMVSFPFSAYFLLPLNNASLFAGAGMSVHSYEETWLTVPLSHKGNRTKPLVYAGVEYRVLPRVAARLALRYETIKSDKNPSLGKYINLGGLTLLGGVSVRIF